MPGRGRPDKGQARGRGGSGEDTELQKGPRGLSLRTVKSPLPPYRALSQGSREPPCAGVEGGHEEVWLTP